MGSSLVQKNGTVNVLGHGRKEEEEENFVHALHLVGSFMMSMGLQAAVELGVFEIIAKAGEGAALSSEEILAQKSTGNPDAPAMLDRILMLLASHSVLSCSVASDDGGSNVRRLYGLRPVSKLFVTNEDGVSLAPFLSLTQDKIFLDSWSHLEVSILEGGVAFNRTHGMNMFEYAGLDLRFNNVFNSGMYNFTTIVMKRILEHYEGFDHLKQLVDVGGSQGMSLNLIISRYPHIKGINFDLPHVIENAPSYPGVEHVGGDMFESVPYGDAIFMKTVLHDWDDEHCLKLLRNCYKSIPDNGKVIVVETVLPIMPENSFAVTTPLAFNVGMMTQNPGGKERNQQEFLALATGAGFSGIRFVCSTFTFSVMEFYK